MGEGHQSVLMPVDATRSTDVRAFGNLLTWMNLADSFCTYPKRSSFSQKDEELRMQAFSSLLHHPLPNPLQPGQTRFRRHVLLSEHLIGDAPACYGDGKSRRMAMCYAFIVDGKPLGGAMP